jgi:16S rRNA (uracil1498-N3)-methyltransferase
MRNLEDSVLYTYEVSFIDKRSVVLTRISQKSLKIQASYPLHIGWCIIDPKNIEKVLPSLNEMGVEKITFIYCKRSQKSFKLDFKRMKKILLNSSQQSGRSVMMQLEIMENLLEFLNKYPESYMLNFSDNYLSKQEKVSPIVIGCEGGFDKEEVALFKSEKIIGLNTPLVLKSESAVCAAASILLF